jgi:hypothetical protein
MPDIDNDLFELLSLIGLGLIVVVGLALLGALGRVRKSLDRTLTESERETAWRGAGDTAAAVPAAASEASLTAAEAEMPDAAAAEDPGEPAPAAVSEGPGVVAAEPEQREPEPAVAEEPSPAHEIAREPEPEPVAAAETAPAASQEVQPVAAEPEPAAEPQPDEAPERELEPVASETPEPVATATADEPEGQPFERDGRWWFRRGDELLVYDEMSGQWQPAPQPAGATETQEVPTVEGESELGSQAPPEAAQPGAFWKCPSCGAVNGSTATSCRMCFTARP